MILTIDLDLERLAGPSRSRQAIAAAIENALRRRDARFDAENSEYEVENITLHQCTKPARRKPCNS